MTAIAEEAPLDLRAAWRRLRLPVVVTALALAVAAGIAAVESAPPPRALGPDDASPVGARAIVTLLRDRGVHVTAVAPATATFSDGASSTVVVTDPPALTREQLHMLATSAADVVLVAPGDRELAALGMPRDQTGEIAAVDVSPACAFGPATVAGRVRVAGSVYAARPGDQSCYPFGGSAALLVRARRGGGETLVFGSRSAWSNAHLADEGDAALALAVLDRRPDVLWLVPAPATAAPGDVHRKGVIELLPTRLWWTLLQAAVVVVLVALWRGRRLGPVVPEQLPSPVRAAETVLGRARLMRAARARGRAAETLRAATTARVSERLGLGPAPDRGAVVESVSRSSGRPAVVVEAVLYGAEPTDDAALVRIAHDLDALEVAVRDARPVAPTSGGST